MKPEYVNAILDVRVIGEISYLRLTEAGETLPSKVLTWVLEYAISNGLNFAWTVNDGHHWIGSPEFTDAFNKQENKELSQ
jgi:predicted type IV restriction endonuclease